MKTNSDGTTGAAVMEVHVPDGMLHLQRDVHEHVHEDAREHAREHGEVRRRVLRSGWSYDDDRVTLRGYDMGSYMLAAQGIGEVRS